MRQTLITFSLLLLFLAGGINLSAQLTTACGPGQFSLGGAPLCQLACITCDWSQPYFDATYPPFGGQPIIIDNCQIGAPPITLENPRWYGFIAASSVVGFNIKLVDSCLNNSGLEAAVLSGCGPSPLKAINCARLTLPTRKFSVSALPSARRTTC
ncbi:MAG: hypothetical protein IPJ82_02910 [Lewinellaceae bacterium]|nr:hypothetical protein [Lewinellaceae bacterium]